MEANLIKRYKLYLDKGKYPEKKPLNFTSYAQKYKLNFNSPIKPPIKQVTKQSIENTLEKPNFQDIDSHTDLKIDYPNIDSLEFYHLI